MCKLKRHRLLPSKVNQKKKKKKGYVSYKQQGLRQSADPDNTLHYYIHHGAMGSASPAEFVLLWSYPTLLFSISSFGNESVHPVPLHLSM